MYYGKKYDINPKKKVSAGWFIAVILIAVKKKKKRNNKWIMNYGGFLLRDPFV